MSESLADFLDDDDDDDRDTQRSRRSFQMCPMCGAKNRPAATKCRECGEVFDAEDVEEPALKGSPLGVASFVVSLLAGAILVGSFAFAAYLVAESGGNLDPDDQGSLMLVGLGVLSGLLVNVVGVVLGIVALFLPGRRKAFAAIGTVIGMVMLLGMLTLLGFGFAMQAAEQDRIGRNGVDVLFRSAASRLTSGSQLA